MISIFCIFPYLPFEMEDIQKNAYIVKNEHLF